MGVAAAASLMIASAAVSEFVSAVGL